MHDETINIVPRRQFKTSPAGYYAMAKLGLLLLREIDYVRNGDDQQIPGDFECVQSVGNVAQHGH